MIQDSIWLIKSIMQTTINKGNTVYLYVSQIVMQTHHPAGLF